MDQMTITYGTLGALLLGGITIIRFMWNIHTKVVEQHSKEDEKLAAVYTKIEDVSKELHERVNRSKDECRKNENDIRESITQVRLELVNRTDLKELEKSIEGNVQATVDTRIAQLEAKIPQMMMEALKTFKP